MNIVLSTRFNLDVQRGTLPSFSKSVISLTKHYDKERRRIRSRRKRTSIAAFARTKRERKGLEGAGVGASSLSLVVFCVVLSRENKENLLTEREISPNEKIMVEVIEILDSDEEGDERVRIVQQNFEPRLRPIREEEGNDNSNINNNNRDEDVVITGAR